MTFRNKTGCQDFLKKPLASVRPKKHRGEGLFDGCGELIFAVAQDGLGSDDTVDVGGGETQGTRTYS
jgi:hypothetical protein